MKQMNVTSKSIVGGKLLTVCAAAHSPNRPLGENRSTMFLVPLIFLR